jgi:4-azaleucine resistance transporter AzlC
MAGVTSGPDGRPPEGQASLRTGVRAVLPLTVAVVGFGISFGILARAAGFGPLAVVVMSGTTFAGSAQFAAASVLEAGGAVSAAVAAAVLLNARYLPLGISVAPILGGPLWKRFLTAQLVVDESWALAARPDGRFDRGILLVSGMALYVAWVGSTTVGALGAEVLGDPAALGLDAAFPALFLAILWPQLRAPSAPLAAALGAAIAVTLIPLAPPGIPVIAAAAACLVGLARR